MTHLHTKPVGLIGALASALALGLILGALPALSAPAAPDPVELLFVYGSEKKEWIKEVTKDFEKTNPKTKDGRPIKVTTVPLGSGETVREVLDGTRKAHLISPASGAYIKLANAEDPTRPLVKETQNLVLSPVVIAMWKPMAEKLGWPRKPIGWEELRQLAADPKGWDSIAPGEKWGRFKFGHTHPDYSNSGLIAIFAQVYAATGKDKGMTVKDVESVRTDKFLGELQKRVVHYGESTGFFGDQMFGGGPDYLSAAVLYENMVVESYQDKWKGKLKYPVVAIYPKEGTFYSDHPVGVVERDWVKPEHREAAKLYIDFLMAEDQQRKALKWGFRPGLEGVKLGDPIDEAHGVNDKEPIKLLKSPSVEVMQACLKSWKQNKKNVRLVLVLDQSGSMRADDKLLNAVEACNNIIKALGKDDTMGILTFSDKYTWVEKGRTLKGDKDREALIAALAKVQPFGETALYDSILEAYQWVEDKKAKDDSEITALIVLTDGADNRSKLKLPDLLKQVKYDPKNGRETRIFTIAYGSSGADVAVLKTIAEDTKGTASVGQPEDIEKVIKKIITFF
jgi:Ca-activated chloride channel family protein